MTRLKQVGICAVLTVVAVAIVFGFSSQSAQVSYGISGGVLGLLEWIGIEITEYRLRKVAHVFMYAFLGGSSTALLVSVLPVKKLPAGDVEIDEMKVDEMEVDEMKDRKFSRRWIGRYVGCLDVRYAVAAICGSLFSCVCAVVDEWNQSHVPGRTGMYLDVRHDAIGFVLGSVLVAVFMAMFMRKCKKSVLIKDDL